MCSSKQSFIFINDCWKLSFDLCLLHVIHEAIPRTDGWIIDSKSIESDRFKSGFELGRVTPNWKYNLGKTKNYLKEIRQVWISLDI